MLLSTRLLILVIGLLIVGGIVILNWLTRKDFERSERAFANRESQMSAMIRRSGQTKASPTTACPRCKARALRSRRPPPPYLKVVK